MKSFAAFKKQLLKDPAVKAEYDRLGPEFALAEALIKARLGAKMTQGQVARKMGTTQSAVARMESGNGFPSTTSLVKYARAVGKELKIGLH
ncbi:MAG: helix-turn-helix transcriptional regulator [Proteobacteria bacterium]|nr:helix-turn-helix transcriptional regulator [Pseudomonadota bacterium]